MSTRSAPSFQETSCSRIMTGRTLQCPRDTYYRRRLCLAALLGPSRSRVLQPCIFLDSATADGDWASSIKRLRNMWCMDRHMGRSVFLRPRPARSHSPSLCPTCNDSTDPHTGATSALPLLTRITNESSSAVLAILHSTQCCSRHLALMDTTLCCWPPARAHRLEGIPSTADNILYPCRHLGQGDVLHPGIRGGPPDPDSSETENGETTQPDATSPSGAIPVAPWRAAPTEAAAAQEADSDAEATALIQLGTAVARRAAKAQQAAGAGCNSLVQGPAPRVQQQCCHVIPTPSGRRVLPIAAELHAQPVQTLSLQALVPVPKPAIAWGVNQDILEHCLAEHEVAVFARDPTDYWPVDPKILRMWRQLPAWDPALPCDELYIFTDGSFFEHAANATWAVVVLAMQGKQIGRVGVRAGVAQGPSQHGDAHARQPSAFDGELEAIMHAMAVAAGTPCRNVHLGADCETAITTAQGQTETAAWDLVSRATVSLHALLTMQSKRLFFHKIKILAHAGCALNGMADSVAKAVGKAPEQGADAVFDNLWSAIVEKTADHLWMVPSHHVTTTSLPYLSDTGTWAQASCNIQLPLAMERPFSMPRPDTTECPVDIDLRVLQYNVPFPQGCRRNGSCCQGPSTGQH